MKKMKVKDLCNFLPKSKIKAGEGLENGKYIFFTSSDTKTLTLNDFVFDEEAIILGTGGKPSCNYYKGKFAVSTDNFVLVSDKIIIKYLYYYLRNNNLFILEKGFHGAGLKHISKDYVNDIGVPIVDVQIQQSIVHNLDLINQKIDYCKSQLLKYDELVKSQFIEMFGDPKYNKENLTKIGSIGILSSGGTPSRNKPEFFEGKIRWYSAGELNSLYLPDSIEHISDEAIVHSSAKMFKKGTLMIGMYDTAAFKMGILTEDSSSNQACVNLNANDKYNVVWLYYLFEIMKPIFLKERHGVRQQNLSLSKIKEFVIPVSSIELQNKFADFVKQIDKSKFIVQKQIKLLEELLEKKMNEYFGN